MLANLLVVAAAPELPAKVVLGWADEPVNRLLDIDPLREAAVALVPLGLSGIVPAQAPPIEPLDLPTLPLSACEVSYQAIRQMHAAASLGSGAEAAPCRTRSAESRRPRSTSEPVPLRPVQGRSCRASRSSP